MDKFTEAIIGFVIAALRVASRWIQPLRSWISSKSQAHVARALDSYRQHDLAKAELQYQRAIRWRPRDADVPGRPDLPSRADLHSSLGQVFYEHDRREDAEHEFREALEHDYNNLRALKGLGILAQERNNLSLAMYLYLRYLESEPDDAGICYNLAVIFHNLGKYEEADQYYKRAEQEDPDDVLTRKAHAALLIRLGRFDEAKNILTHAFQVGPVDSELDRLLGLTLEFQGDKKGALEHYKSAVSHDDSDAEAHFLFANVASDLGQLQEGVQHARKAIELYHSAGNNEDAAQAALTLGWVYYKMDDFKSSIKASTEALELSPDVPAHCNLGLALLLDGKVDEARKAYATGCARSDQISRFGLLAIEDLREAMAKNPNLQGAAEILQTLQAKYAAAAQELVKSSQKTPATEK